MRMFLTLSISYSNKYTVFEYESEYENDEKIEYDVGMRLNMLELKFEYVNSNQNTPQYEYENEYVCQFNYEHEFNFQQKYEYK